MIVFIFYDIIVTNMGRRQENQVGTTSNLIIRNEMMGKTRAKTKKSINPFSTIKPTQNDDETSQNNIGRIVSANDQLSKIEENLNSVVDSLHDNPSLLTRMANRWGALPGWAKIVGGILFFGIFFTVGILAHLAVVIGISAVTATGFTVGSVVLDDHYKSSKQSKDMLKSGMLSLGNLLKSTILVLDKICEQLATEIDKFKQENTRLSEGIDVLNEDLRTLRAEIDDLSLTKEALATLQIKFEETANDFERLHQLLNARIEELERIKSKMSSQIEEQQGMVTLLQGTLDTFSTKIFGEDTERNQFILKMKAFIQDGSASFSTIAERICKAEKELSKTQHALDESNRRYEKLIEKHTGLVDRFEQLITVSPTKDTLTPISPVFFPPFSRKDFFDQEITTRTTNHVVSPTQ